MAILQWPISIALALFWTTAFLANGYVMLRRIAGRFDSPSPIPLVGSVAGALAVLLVPIGTIQDRLPFVAIAFLADIVLPVEGIAEFLYSRFGKS